jgi:sugar/nucleoside kinase (ribokinase family)
MPIARPAGIVCCGNISMDMPVWPVDTFHWGTTTWVDTIQENIGGNGGNTSTALAVLGVPVRLYGTVGSDRQGEFILDFLSERGVDTSCIERSEKPTTCTVALVHPSGDRLFLHRVGSSTDVNGDAVRFDDGPEFSHFHLANLFALPVVRLQAGDMLARAKARGLSTSLDTGWDARGRWVEDVRPCLPHTDLLFVNESEAKMLTGIDDPDAAVCRLRAGGATDVVVKLGERGCVVYQGDSREAFPAYDVQVIDTTGAGDCFAGGFLAALHRGLSYADAARLANAVGALSVERLGTVLGVRSWAETEQWMATARLRAITAPA